MLSHLNDAKTITVPPVNLLQPQEESPVGPAEEEGEPPPAAPAGPRRGHGRGRRVKGRRPGAAAAAAAASKNKGEREINRTDHVEGEDVFW